jgi:hypothetical protein
VAYRDLRYLISFLLQLWMFATPSISMQVPGPVPKTGAAPAGLLVGLGALSDGLVLLLASVNQWRQHDFGRLEYAETMRWVIPGVTLTALGFQTVLSCFFLSILGMRRK